ncbi:MAG: hypothetical protein GEU94_04760 [Micromonosporaceae bacterium]|nr:hypothetical protein [Micromonosporaceae bacterium]
MRPSRGDWSEVDQLSARHAFGQRFYASSVPSPLLERGAQWAGPAARRSVAVLHHPRSASVVRRELSAHLAEHADRLGVDLLADAASVATELVGNAINHARPLAGGVILVDWQTYPRGLHISVTDGGSPQSPQLRRVGPDSLTGRGLAIVASLSARWGITPSGTGRCVWAWLGQVSRVAS